MINKRFAILILITLLLTAGIGCSRKNSEGNLFSKQKGEDPIPTEMYPGDYTQLAEYALDRGETDKALDYCREALKIDPDYAEAYYVIGMANMINGNHDIARDSFEKALDLDPQLTMAHAYLGSLYYSLGEYQESIKQFDMILEKAKSFALFNNHRGLAHLLRGNLDKAKQDFDNAISKEPDDAAGYDNKALVLLLQNREDDAKKLVEKAMEINPDLPGPYESLGIIKILKGDYQTARGQLKKAIQTDNRVPLARYFLYYIEKKQGNPWEETLQEALLADLKQSHEGLKVIEALSKHYRNSRLGQLSGEIHRDARKAEEKRLSNPPDTSAD